MRRWIDLFETTSPAAQVVEFVRNRYRAISGAVDLDIGVDRHDPRVVQLHNITVYDRGKGIGRQVMALLLGAADQYGVAIELEVGPEYDAEGEGEVLDGSDLVDWYQRLGFAWAENSGNLMRREPQG